MDTNQYEYPHCLICNSTENRPFLEVENRFNKQEVFNLVECTRCQFIYLSPRPTARYIDKYYENASYQPHQSEPSTLESRLYQFVRVWNNRYKRRMIEKYHRNGMILDYGCGTGEFLHEMKKNGWDTLGFEPANQAAEKARTYDVKLTDDISRLDEQFDVITLWHVLEHVHQANHLLENLRKLMHPKTLLVIAVPNCLSIDAGIFRENWVAYDPPRHLYHFQPQHMKSFLLSKGIQVFQTRTLLFDPWFNSLISAKLESNRTSTNLYLKSLPKGMIAALLSTIKSLIDKEKASSIVYFAGRDAADQGPVNRFSETE